MNQSTVSVPHSYISDMLKFVELSSYTIKRASEENAVFRAQQKRADELRGPVLAELLEVHLVAPTAKQAADAMLASHAETLQLLKAAADLIVKLNGQLGAKTANDLGGPDAHRPAGDTPHRSLTTPFVGQPTTEKKASDEALLEVLRS